MTPEERKTYARNPVFCPKRMRLVVPSDTVDLPYIASALFIAKDGNVSFLPTDNPDNEPVLAEYMSSGQYILAETRRVRATGTTAIVYAMVD